MAHLISSYKFTEMCQLFSRMGVGIIICHIDLHSKETCFYFHGLIVSATTITEILTIYIIFFAKKCINTKLMF